MRGMGRGSAGLCCSVESMPGKGDLWSLACCQFRVPCSYTRRQSHPGGHKLPGNLFQLVYSIIQPTMMMDSKRFSKEGHKGFDPDG